MDKPSIIPKARPSHLTVITGAVVAIDVAARRRLVGIIQGVLNIFPLPLPLMQILLV